MATPVDAGTVYYTVDAKTQPLIEAEAAVSKSMDRMEQSTKGADKAVDGLGVTSKKTESSTKALASGVEKSAQAAEKAIASTSSLTNEVQKSGAAASASTGQLTSLAGAIKTVIAAVALNELAGMVQGYQEMAERVQMATSSTEEFRRVQQRLMATANGTYRNLTEAQELFISTADSLKIMGYNTEQAMDVQDSLSYAFVTNATSADKAKSAIDQFTKATISGKVSADQWMTIMSAVPTVVNDIAAATGKSAAEILQLGAAGKLAARDLTEGLRQALDANAKAAEGMANNLTDAGVRSKNAITAVLVALEEETGALQTLTETIINASNYVLEFTGDSDKMSKALKALEVVGVSVAAVIAGRVVMALGAYTVSQYASIKATIDKMNAESLAASATLRKAEIEKIAALASLQLAQADFAAARGSNAHQLAREALTAAQGRYAAATTAAAAAQSAANSVTTAGAVAMTALNRAMAFLGGPAGVALLAAGALYTYITRAKEAKGATLDLSQAVNTLSQAQRELSMIETVKAIQGQQEELTKLAKRYKDVSDQIDGGMVKATDRVNERQARTKVEIEQTTQRLADYKKRLQELTNFKPSEAPTLTGPAEPTTSTEGQKALDAMRQQIELAKLTGEARARLAAIQALGANATKEEKEEAERLASTLYKLEQAHKDAKEATKNASSASKEAAKSAKEAADGYLENEKVIASFNEQLYQLTLTSEQLAARKAELQLNEYATPEQIAEVRALAIELQQAEAAAQELAKRRAAFGEDWESAVKGDVKPLSGGAFDNQAARYEAEAEAEQERYAKQLERLREAKELQLGTEKEYQELEYEAAKAHAERMNQIDQARKTVMIASMGDAVGGVADLLKASMGEQSKAYKAMFAVSKAFSIANAGLALGTALSEAWKLPWPANLAAAGTAAANMATIASNIQSIQMAGGRQYGGPVEAGKGYRINENGAPEIFQAANGQQFMLPNTRGEVISNKDALAQSGGNGSGVVINIKNYSGEKVQTSQSAQDVIDIIVGNLNEDGQVASTIQGKWSLNPTGI